MKIARFLAIITLLAAGCAGPCAAQAPGVAYSPAVGVSAPMVAPAPQKAAAAVAVAPIQADNSVINPGAVFGQAIAPYINSLVFLLVTLFVGWIKYEAKQKYDIDLNQIDVTKLQTALANRAGSLVADGFVKVAVNGATNVEIGKAEAEAADLINRNKDTAERLGLTPDHVAAMIVDKLPQVPAVAQAQAAALAAAPKASA